MGKLATLQDQWVRMERDRPRLSLRPGSAWTMTDWIPQQDAELRARGGWSNASNDISATVATSSYVIGGLYANYVAGDKNMVWDEDGRLVTIASNGTVTDVGASRTVKQNPVIHRDKVIVCDDDGTTAPQKVTNSAGTLTIAALGGSPPAAIYSTVFHDRTILGNTAANNNRIWFSDPGDPEGWDTTNVFWDFTYPITGLAALRTSLLVFHDSYMSRLRGSTPPPGSDFIADDPLFNVGTTDCKSIVLVGDRIVFANPEGIFITDGSAEPASLTKLTGMQNYWREQMSAYDKSTWHIAAGFQQGFYTFSVMDGTTFKFAGMIDLDRLSWLGLTNVDARCMWTAEATADKLYFGRRGAARVGDLSTIFIPSSTVKNDGDGDAVLPVLEGSFSEGQKGMKAWTSLTVGAQVTDYASDNPTLSFAVTKTPEGTASYANLTGTFGENTKRTYKSFPLGFESEGIGYKITKANAGDVRLWSVEAKVHAKEPSRRTNA